MTLPYAVVLVFLFNVFSVLSVALVFQRCFDLVDLWLPVSLRLLFLYANTLI